MLRSNEVCEYVVPKKCSMFLNFSFSFKEPYVWNSFDNQEIKKVRSFALFKQKVKSVLLSQ